MLLMMPGKAEAASAEIKAGAVTTSGGRLNVRSRPTSSSDVVSTLNKGSYITLISRSGDWWYVQYGNNRFGYCHKDYITVVQGSPAMVQTASGALNVRTAPGTGSSRVATLPRGEEVLVLSSSNGWSRILYHGIKTGYVSSQYLSGSYQAVSLSVPDFKQMDTRWANVPIGQSGKTMAQIGCATTAIAMMESSRRGRTVYPDEMVRELRYTPSGSVYWPEEYKVVTNTDGYLAVLYEKLRQGRPVLFGARNAFGKQHWVVITGFSGGSTLTPGGFTIHDPGTVKRNTLQQFLLEYPSIYKYFYY